MKLLMLFVAFCMPLLLSAQEWKDRVQYNTVDGDGQSKGYLYPEFRDGKVFFKDGTFGAAKMNFNGLTSEMLFISPQNDTLRILRPETTVMVTIATDTFCFYQKTFLKKITFYSDAPNLFVSPDLKFVTIERAVPYGYSAVTATASYNNFMNVGGTMVPLSEDRNLIFARSKEMFIRNEKGRFVRLKQASFYSMFPPAFKSRIKAFVDAEGISFKDRKEVIKLIDHIHSLKAADPEGGKS